MLDIDDLRIWDRLATSIQYISCIYIYIYMAYLLSQMSNKNRPGNCEKILRPLRALSDLSPEVEVLFFPVDALAMDGSHGGC